MSRQTEAPEKEMKRAGMSRPCLDQLPQSVSQALDGARRLWLRPDLPALACSLEELAKAKCCLETFIAGAGRLPASAGSRPLEELAGVGRGLLRARALLDQGIGFWEGWTRYRNALTDGYGAEGGPVQPPARGTLALEA